MTDEPDPIALIPEPSKSPRWNNTTKLIVGLSIVVLLGLFLGIYRKLIGPLLLAVILSFLMYPVADVIRKKLKFSWRAASTVSYFLLVLTLGGLLAWGGIALIEQLISLVRFIQKSFDQIPTLLEQWGNTRWMIGPFMIDFTQIDINNLSQQVLTSIQGLVGRIGSILTSLAATTANMIGWFFFIMVVSYFLLYESLGTKNRLINFDIPGYQDDIRNFGRELAKIWNAFLWGQLIIFAVTLVVYTILLGILGVRYYYVLALLAGLARFVPYIGPAIAWLTYGLVAYFQGTTLFGMEPIWYVALVVGISWITDMIMDNFVVPTLMSERLRVHPAGVLVAALVGIQWFGVIAVILAAPVLATFMLIFNYAIYKLADKDPWEEMEKRKAMDQLDRAEHKPKLNYWQKMKSLIMKKNLPSGKGENE